MAKLSDFELGIGRQCVKNKDLPELVKWASRLNIPTLDLSLLHDTFQHYFLTDDMNRAIWRFNQYFNKVDPEEERRKWRWIVISIFLKLCLLGGLVYWAMYWAYEIMR